MRRAVVAAVVILLAACDAGQLSPTTTGSSSVAAPTAGSPVPSNSSSPAMTFDPSSFGAPGPAPAVTVHHEDTAGGVTTEDLSFSTGDVSATDAYLVKPARSSHGPSPAILWFHWLETGAPTSNRTEFLDEARGLATRGVVSVLVQGTFPWRDQPVSLAHDVAAVEAEVRMARTALDLLVHTTDVDPKRVAIVGHDFGAMYASLLFGSDQRVSALVMMAPTARWADWFLPYWAIADPHPAYIAAMAPLDPLTWLAHGGGRPILLQFADHDAYVPASVAREIIDAAGVAGETRTYDVGHELNAAAQADRDAWLANRLGLN